MNRAPTWVRPAANAIQADGSESRPYPRQVVAVSGWRLETAEMRRMRCHRIPTRGSGNGRPKAGYRLGQHAVLPLP